MTGYTKLFSSILMSSIWEESNETRLVWVTMLALADQYGHVDGTVKSLARLARVTQDECQAALDCFLSPDPHDRSGVADGRRIVAENGGWTLINHMAYRQKMSADERRQRDRDRKRAKRVGDDVSAGRPQTSAPVREFQQAEAEAKADQKQISSEQKTKSSGGVFVSPLDYDKLTKNHAYVGARLRVPKKIHGDFVALVGGDEPEAELRAWYAELDAELERTKEAIVPDIWKWMEARFKAWQQQRKSLADEAKKAVQSVERAAADAEYQAMRARVVAEQDARAASLRGE